MTGGFELLMFVLFYTVWYKFGKLAHTFAVMEEL